MTYVPVEKLLDKSNGSIYQLVNLAALRALEIAEGAPKLVSLNSGTKPTTIALEEIIAGKVECKKEKSR